VHANLACTTSQGLWLMCMPNWHAHQALGCCRFGMHNSHRPIVHTKLACTTILGWLCMPVYAQPSKACYACTPAIGLLCMPIWHAQQPKALCACQFGMHNRPMDVVHANLACTIGLWLLCMPNWHAQHPKACCACQFGMQNNHRPVVHAK
jgi:hypothetical protein